MLTWNLEWASAKSPRGKILVDTVKRLDPDFAVFTEVTVPWLELLSGHVALSDADYGYGQKGLRRKVSIWSSQMIDEIDDLGSAELPKGRYVSGFTHGVNVAGLCIPWRDAHVRTGRSDKSPWQEHMAYLHGLKRLKVLDSQKLFVGGDFNQRKPRFRQSEVAYNTLDVQMDHLVWHTAGKLAPINKQSIDHILSSNDISIVGTNTVSNYHANLRLSDHFGVYCDFEMYQ